MDPHVFEKSGSARHINEQNDTIQDIEKYFYNYPAFLTHNIRSCEYLDSSISTNPPKYKKRALADVSTDSFIKTIFENKNTLLDFTDYVYHYINYGIMTNINIQLAADKQDLLDLNSEQVFLIFKGGNILHIYYNYFNDIIADINQKTQDPALRDIFSKYTEDAGKFFKISDCDFSLYIITKNSARYNLLFSYAVPIVISQLKDIRNFFERQFIERCILINNPQQEPIPALPQITLVNYNDANYWVIEDIKKLDGYITDEEFINKCIIIRGQDYLSGIDLFRRLINYSITRSAYIIYHCINILNVLYIYIERYIKVFFRDGLGDPIVPVIPVQNPNNQDYNNYMNALKYGQFILDIIDNNPPNIIADLRGFNYDVLTTRITDLKIAKTELFNECINFKESRLQNFYTLEKLIKLLQASINNINCDYGNTIVEYKTYMKVPPRNQPDENPNFVYGEKYIREFTFSGYISGRDPVTNQPLNNPIINEDNASKTFSPIVRLEQLHPARRSSFMINPNTSLANSQILTLIDDVIINPPGVPDPQMQQDSFNVLYSNIKHLENTRQTELERRETEFQNGGQQRNPVILNVNYHNSNHASNCNVNLDVRQLLPRWRQNVIDILSQPRAAPPGIEESANEHYHYITMNFLNTKYPNTDFNINFALIRLKMNFEYVNHDTQDGLNIDKTRYKLMPDGSLGQEIPYPEQAQQAQQAQQAPIDDDEDTLKTFKMPSEFIDIGITHFSDYNYTNTIDHLAQDHLYNSFSNIQYNSDGQDFLIGYSLNYIIYDIYQMLWMQTAMPWSDKKFNKRIERLCALTIYTYIREEFIKEINTAGINITQNINITEAQFDTALRNINILDKWGGFKFILINLKMFNKYKYTTDPINYTRIFNLIVNRYFKFPELITNKQLLFKINEKNFNYLLECKDEYKQYGDFIITVLHYIFNKYIYDTCSAEEIYNFYYNICIRSNFLLTNDLEKYLGKRTDINNNVTYEKPQNDEEKNIFNNVKSYLKKYIDILTKWITFFDSFIFAPHMTLANKHNIANILVKNIQSIPNQQHGGKKTKLRNKHLRKTHSAIGKKTVKKIKGGSLTTQISSSIFPKSFTTNKPTNAKNITGISTSTSTSTSTNSIGNSTKQNITQTQTQTQTQTIPVTETETETVEVPLTENTEFETEEDNLIKIDQNIISTILSDISKKNATELFNKIEFKDFKLFSDKVTEEYRNLKFGQYQNNFNE